MFVCACVHVVCDTCKAYMWHRGLRHWCHPGCRCTLEWLSLCTGCLTVTTEALHSYVHLELAPTHRCTQRSIQVTFKEVREFTVLKQWMILAHLRLNCTQAKRQAYKSASQMHKHKHTTPSTHTWRQRLKRGLICWNIKILHKDTYWTTTVHFIINQ